MNAAVSVTIQHKRYECQCLWWLLMRGQGALCQINWVVVTDLLCMVMTFNISLPWISFHEQLNNIYKLQDNTIRHNRLFMFSDEFSIGNMLLRIASCRWQYSDRCNLSGLMSWFFLDVPSNQLSKSITCWPLLTYTYVVQTVVEYDVKLLYCWV